MLGAQDFQQLTKLPCRHSYSYCYLCIQEMFESFLRDSRVASLCCERIPLSLVADILGSVLTTKVRFKMIAQESSDKTFSSKPTCSEFILPIACIGELLFAARNVGRGLALNAKREAHDGQPCKPYMDVGTAKMLTLAEREGRARCPGQGCGRAIEKIDGCNHMT
jgi:hypothetical protein